MIKYSLTCKSCDLTFESWFASSKEFEKLKRNKILSCHNCNSLKIEKSLMAPNLISKKSHKTKDEKGLKKYNKIKKTITEYQKFIKNNFEYVGNNFAYEARSIHYDKKKNKKVFMVQRHKKKLRSLKKRALILRLYLGLKIKVINS